MTITQPPEPEAAALRRRIAELEARVQAQSTDNEQLRREHAAMVASERELTAIFRAMTDVVMVVDRGGRYLKIAPTAPDLLYAPSHELVGKTILEALGPEAHAQFVPPINRALDRREIVTLEYFLPIAGKQIWFQGAISPMTEDAVVFVARNITDLKEALRHTIQQEELIHAQSAALAELSSPLIPIDDDIVVMPSSARSTRHASSGSRSLCSPGSSSTAPTSPSSTSPDWRTRALPSPRDSSALRVPRAYWGLVYS